MFYVTQKHISIDTSNIPLRVFKVLWTEPGIWRNYHILNLWWSGLLSLIKLLSLTVQNNLHLRSTCTGHFNQPHSPRRSNYANVNKRSRWVLESLNINNCMTSPILCDVVEEEEEQASQWTSSGHNTGYWYWVNTMPKLQYQNVIKDQLIILLTLRNMDMFFNKPS